MIRARTDRLFERFRRAGDPRALAGVFDRTAPELWRVAAHLCRDRHEAEDLVQGTFLTAIEDKESWDPARPVLPWLLGILANHARETRRRLARAIDPARLAPPAPPDPAVGAGRAELGDAMRGALARVPSPYRETLEQHLVAGKAPHEIAAEQGLAQGTVRMRVHRGLDHLRRHLPRGFVTAGAVALRVPPESLAAMREVVLAKVPGGAVAAAAAGSGHTLLTLIGVLAMNKILLTVTASTAVALAAWLAWPSHEGGARIAAPVSSGVGAIEAARAPGAESVETAAVRGAAAPRTQVPAGAVIGSGRLRIVVRNAASGDALPGALIFVQGKRIHYARTGADGIAALDVAAGAVRVQLPALSRDEFRAAEVVAGAESEVVFDLPPQIRVDVSVVDPDGHPVPGARIVGRTAIDPGNLVERELGRTGGDGHWQAALVEPRVALRGIAERWAATNLVEVQARVDRVVPVELRVSLPAATIAGVVRGVDGAPVADAGVAIEPGGPGAPHQIPIVAAAREDGSFEVSWAPPGPCTVFAWRTLGDGQKRMTRADTEAFAGGRTVVDLRFGRGARVFGVIRRADGQPAADAAVSVQQGRSDFWVGLADANGFATTAADGSYSIEGMMPGPYRLQARVDDADVAEDVALTEGQELRWEPSFGAAMPIDVRVLRHDGAPLAGWTVAAAPVRGVVRRATTDAEGRARFDGVSDGIYRLEATAPGALFASVVQPDVRAGTSAVLIVTADALPDAGVRGVLRPASGVALPEMTVRLMRHGGNDRHEIAVHPADGSFAVGALIPGTYDLLVERDRAILAFRRDFVVAGGRELDLGTIDVGAPASVVFEVVRSDGTSATDAFIGGRAAGQDVPFARVAQERVAEGVEVRDVPPFTFEVLVWGTDIAPVVTSATARPGERQIVPVVATPAVTTTVRFERDDGGPLGGTVSVRHAGGAVLAAERLRDGKSSPWIRGLAPGSYRIELRARDGAAGTADLTVGATPGDAVVVPVRR